MCSWMWITLLAHFEYIQPAYTQIYLRGSRQHFVVTLSLQYCLDVLWRQIKVARRKVQLFSCSKLWKQLLCDNFIQSNIIIPHLHQWKYSSVQLFSATGCIAKYFEKFRLRNSFQSAQLPHCIAKRLPEDSSCSSGGKRVFGNCRGWLCATVCLDREGMIGNCLHEICKVVRKMGTVLKLNVSILPVNKIVSTQICPGERRRNKIIYTFSLAMRKLPTISAVKSEGQSWQVC